MSEDKFYVSNSLLYQEYKTWYEAIELALAANVEEPPIPPFIIESMMKIANRLLYKQNFINYSFGDEMVSDAIYDCVRFIKKFKLSYKVERSTILQKIGEVEQIPVEKRSRAEIARLRRYNDMRELMDKTNVDFVIKQGNPFNYLTTISNNAFLRRIDKEKCQQYIKASIACNSVDSDFFDGHCNEDDVEFSSQYMDFLREVGYSEESIPMSIRRNKSKRVSVDPGPLEYFEDEEI